MIDFGSFLTALMGSPVLIVVLALTLGATVINGATDAPNAIATVVGTRSMSPGAAIVMAAVCNFIGLVVVTTVGAAVAKTIFGMVNFGGDSQAALLALAAAMIAIIVWGVATWYFGIPSSQSHSLIAGITGAAIALQSGIGGVNGAEWVKVLYGLVISTGLGFFCGWLFTKVIEFLARGLDRRRSARFWHWAQILAGAGVAVMHGAQDGQKFLSISMMGIMLCMGMGMEPNNVSFPMWLVLLCALTMGLGAAVGGKRIIKSVGMDMVKMEPYEGFAACLSAIFCIGLANETGMPVSTTHTKTTAIMGVGASKRLSNVKWGKAGNMVLAWILTFPGCGIIGYVLAKIFLLF